MPRKPTRRGHLRKPQPSFSRLARSMALVASARKVKQQNENSRGHRKVPPNSTAGLEPMTKGQGEHLNNTWIPLAYKPIGCNMLMIMNVPVNNCCNDSSKEKQDTTEAKREESHFSSEDQDFSSEDDFEGVVQADFAFFDPKPDDFHGVKVLMQTYLDNKVWDLSGFVDLILQQTTVGTVIKIEEDEDDGVYGFVTALNLQRYKDYKCMMELKEFLLSMCQDKQIKDNLISYLGDQAVDVGLLISQRVVNLPPQLLPPMYDGLFDEISWATEDEPTMELRKSFCFKYYLLVSKIYKHKNGDQKKKGSCSSEEAIIYLKPEDEIFHNLSAWSFCFPLRTQQVTANELKDYRSMGLVMAVKATSVTTFRQQLHSLIDET